MKTDSYLLGRLEHIETAQTLDATDIDAIQLSGIECYEDLPLDTFLTVTVADRTIVRVPLSRMTRLHERLWTIPFQDFAAKGLPGRCLNALYLIHLQSVDVLPSVTLHYRIMRLSQGPESVYEFQHYELYESSRIELPPRILTGVFLQNIGIDDLRIILTVNGMTIYDWNYMQMLLEGVRQGLWLHIETVPIDLARFAEGLLVLSKWTPIYLITVGMLHKNAEGHLYVVMEPGDVPV